MFINFCFSLALNFSLSDREVKNHHHFITAAEYKCFLLRIELVTNFMYLWYIDSYPANTSRGMCILLGVKVGVVE